MREVITLSEFIVQSQEQFPGATGALSSVLRAVELSAKLINREVTMAGLVDIIGTMGVKNAYGEEVAKLDDFSNEIMIRSLRNCGDCCGVASEEEEDIHVFQEELCKKGRYVVLMDPLDGSSNIDVNVSIGTIFSIFERVSPQGEVCTHEDFLQEGSKQVAAGYVVYGPSAMFVYSAGQGVHGFTLDPSIGEFCLSHQDMTTPWQGKILSINEGNTAYFSEGTKAYVNWCKEIEKESSRPYGCRYVGSMIADLHRNLIKGGIFIYPATTKSPAGKLRLLYECNPFAFLIVQAGGLATDGQRNLLDIKPKELHQRMPIFIGSGAMVEKAMEFLKVHDIEKVEA